MKRAKNRKSKVDLLPSSIRDQLNALLREGSMTQKDIRLAINQLIDESGLPEDAKLSRSGFNQYAKRMESMGLRIKQAREVAEVWTTKLGDAPLSDIGKLLQEFVRTMAFETSMHMMDEAAKEGADPIPPKALGQLALVVQRIEQAAMSSHKVEKAIREEAKKEIAEQTEKIVKRAGISEETAADIRRKILGME
ncbi:DUF3486 family protein [Vibrio mediterranei]